MKLLLAITACWLLAGSAVAQRGGMGGGFRGGMGGGFRGGFGGFRPGNCFFFGQQFFNRGFYGYGGSVVYPSCGLGFSYYPGYADYPYDALTRRIRLTNRHRMLRSFTPSRHGPLPRWFTFGP